MTSPTELDLTNLTPGKGSNKKRIRKGRGASARKGRSAGRGRGGSGHRSGLSIKGSFEGGQMPLVRRLPKRGFSNIKFAKVFEIVNTGQLQEKFKSGQKVDADKLKEGGLIKGKHPVKILGKGDLKKKLKISGCVLSAGARKKIEDAGGTIE